MKKLQILAVVLAMGTICICGCNMGGANSSQTTVPETQSIIAQDENEGEDTPTPCPDDNCNNGRMPFKKPGFKFRVPHGKDDKNGREKFRRPHRKPAPTPEPEPEIPETPEEN